MPPIALRPLLLAKVQRAALLSLVSAIALAGCGRPEATPPGGAGATTAASGASKKPTAAMTVTVATIRSAPITRTVEATGSIQPWQEVIIGPEVGGYRVSAVLVDVGDSVKRGQTLVKLSADLLEADVASKRAALSSAEARAINAEAALRRGRAVLTSGALSQANVDQLDADAVAARAQVDTARADLASSQLRLRYTQVTAADDGVITSRTVSVGQVAQAGAELLRMLRQNRIEWRAEVPESLLAQIHPGQNVTLTSADGSHIQGKVRTVGPTVTVANRTALVYVDLPNGSARPGMFARGNINVGKGDGLLVPVQSVVMQDGYAYVFVVGENSVVSRRLIKTANVQGDDIEAVSGVKPGETVALKGAGFLKDGDTVQIAREAATGGPATTAKVAQ